MDFSEHCQSLAEGKLQCPCGNTDWRQFLFVGATCDLHAACKRCGKLYHHTTEGWKGESQ